MHIPNYSETNIRAVLRGLHILCAEFCFRGLRQILHLEMLDLLLQGIHCEALRQCFQDRSIGLYSGANLIFLKHSETDLLEAAAVAHGLGVHPLEQLDAAHSSILFLPSPSCVWNLTPTFGIDCSHLLIEHSARTHYVGTFHALQYINWPGLNEDRLLGKHNE